MSTLNQPDPADCKDQEIEDAWATEVERRIDESEIGRAALIPAAESIARARAAIK